MELFNRAGVIRVPNTPDGTYSYVARCNRCGGAGGRKEWDFTGWTCYDCGGSGLGRTVIEKLYSAEKLAKLNAAQDKREAKRQAEYVAKAALEEAARIAHAEAFRVEHAEFCDKLDTLTGDFWNDFREGFYHRQKSPSVKQIELVDNELAKRNAPQSQYIGAIGEKVTLNLTCEKVVDCSWGSYPRIVSYMHICKDDTGNFVIYKGAGQFLNEGDCGTIKATIKDHSQYNGVAQTYIQRPTVLA